MPTTTPPKKVSRREISKAASNLERMRLRRRAMVKKLGDLDAEISQAKRMLNALVSDVTAQAQAALADDLAEHQHQDGPQYGEREPA